MILLPCLACAATLDRTTAMAQRADGLLANTVDKAKRHDRALGAAELFQAMFYFCETGRHLDRIDLLLDVAAEMQDRNPDSRTFGNFRWTWRDGFVMDLNAVDFCMQYGSLIARDHISKMSPTQREKFLAILDRAIAGCLAHRVLDSYTNIAIMNAANLILLGEARERNDMFEEGVKRLHAFTLNVALFGVHEYASPTYTAVDIENLHRLHAYVHDPAVRDRAERLLKLFYTDICASAFAPAGRLAGPHSRDYDYLYGMGGVAALLRAGGAAVRVDLAEHLSVFGVQFEHLAGGRAVDVDDVARAEIIRAAHERVVGHAPAPVGRRPAPHPDLVRGEFRETGGVPARRVFDDRHEELVELGVLRVDQLAPAVEGLADQRIVVAVIARPFLGGLAQFHGVFCVRRADFLKKPLTGERDGLFGLLVEFHVCDSLCFECRSFPAI